METNPRNCRWYISVGRVPRYWDEIGLIKEIHVDWRVLFKVEYHKFLEEVLKRHEEVFREELGTYTGDFVKILLDIKECH